MLLEPPSAQAVDRAITELISIGALTPGDEHQSIHCDVTTMQIAMRHAYADPDKSREHAERANRAQSTEHYGICAGEGLELTALGIHLSRLPVDPRVPANCG